ncbi:MAG: hypothetical protein MPL62_12950 [Alphaproteobacteria bacterium]|nr:hypothetical protein [Alphaproteobacteria bacterium]
MTEKSKPKQDVLQSKQEVLQRMIGMLNPMSDQDRLSIINSILAFYNLSHPAIAGEASTSADVATKSGRDPIFSGHEELHPKSFLSAKSPQTDVERVACLAYYLANYRDKKYFTTADISALNVEAAQRKLSNPSLAMKNAIACDYLVDAKQKKSKQLSVFGEDYVDALPDREAVKAVRARHFPKRKKRKKAVARNRMKEK